MAGAMAAAERQSMSAIEADAKRRATGLQPCMTILLGQGSRTIDNTRSHRLIQASPVRDSAMTAATLRASTQAIEGALQFIPRFDFTRV
jgi:hypothetical protein